MKKLTNSVILTLAVTTGALVQAQTFKQSFTAYERRDYRMAFSGFRKAAEQGDADAQYNLGVMHDTGQGVPKDKQQAAVWFRKAAEQGDASAQNKLGLMHAKGQGVPKDEQQAAAWYRKAAEQGHGRGQYNLGVMYSNGLGMPKDEQSAYFWWLLASAQGNRDAVEDRDLVERDLSPEQRAAAQAAARNCKPKNVAQSSDVPGGRPRRPNAKVVAWDDLTVVIRGSNTAPSRPALASAEPDSTGSGFRVARGAIVTYHHVIDGCSSLRVNGTPAQLRGSDARSDLALLGVNVSGPSSSLRAQRAAVGEPVAVAGYPLRGLLSRFNMTIGNLSSLSGIGGDTRLLQITAPVQPGNSGGPILDSAGNLMGVVVSKLDAIKAAMITGDIPQNVNFAINTKVAHRPRPAQQSRLSSGWVERSLFRIASISESLTASPGLPLSMIQYHSPWSLVMNSTFP